MNARIFPLILALLAFPQAVLAQQISRTASVPNLTLQVTVLHDYQGAPILDELFTTNDPYKHGVYCLSGFTMPGICFGIRPAVLYPSTLSHGNSVRI